MANFVIPAKAGIHETSQTQQSVRVSCLDPRFRGDDVVDAFRVRLDRTQGHPSKRQPFHSPVPGS
jgi:uncharacterized lipoprotein YmbA